MISKGLVAGRRCCTGVLAGIFSSLIPRVFEGYIRGEDLVQEVWAVALPRLKDLVPRDDRLTPVLVRFLSQTLLNIYCNLMRKHIRRENALHPRGSPSSEQGFSSQLAVRTRGAITWAMVSEAVRELERRRHGLQALMATHPCEVMRRA